MLESSGCEQPRAPGHCVSTNVAALFSLSAKFRRTAMEIEALLQPISPDSTCGEDLSYDVSLQELETLLRGKEETQFSVAEDPDWKQVRAQCTEIFRRTKDLRVAVILSVALLKLDSLPGLRDGLTLLRSLIQDYWVDVYPRLDPEDDNDPVERMNILAGITKPIGTFGDPLKFIERLRQAPLADSSRMGRFSLAHITGIGLAADKSAAPPAEVTAAFRDTPPEKVEEVARAAAEAQQALKEIDSLLTEHVGASRAPNFDELYGVLKEIQTNLRPHLPSGSAGAVAADGAPESSGATAAAGVPVGIAGISSRDDVVRALEKICDYYKAAEPGSPVPLLLRRAQRMVQMDFLALMQDLAPDSLAQVSLATGKAPEATE